MIGSDVPSQQRKARTITVTTPRGVHARAATLVRETVLRFRAKVEIIKGTDRVDASDVLQMLSLGAADGDQLLLEATGEEADAALDALVQLFEEFGEEARDEK
jgi:phosphotransferase system HPr (HPr) family protein